MEGSFCDGRAIRKGYEGEMRMGPISALPCHRCSLLKLIKDRVEVFSSRLSRAEGLPLLSVSGLAFLKSFGKISLIFQIPPGNIIRIGQGEVLCGNIISSEESFSDPAETPSLGRAVRRPL